MTRTPTCLVPPSLAQWNGKRDTCESLTDSVSLRMAHTWAWAWSCWGETVAGRHMSPAPQLPIFLQNSYAITEATRLAFSTAGSLQTRGFGSAA